MIVEAWHPLIEYHLNFGAIDMLYDLCILIHKKYKIESNISQDKLLKFLEDFNDKEIERGIRNLYNMVPYRLLAPFFVGEFKGIPDHRRNKKIAELSNLKYARKYFGYKHNEEGELIINEEQAIVVRVIFELFLKEDESAPRIDESIV